MGKYIKETRPYLTKAGKKVIYIIYIVIVVSAEILNLTYVGKSLSIWYFILSSLFVLALVELNLIDVFIEDYLKEKLKDDIEIERTRNEAESYKNMYMGRRAEIDSIVANSDKVKAEAFEIIQRANLSIPQNALLNKIVSEMDLNNITPSQAFVLCKALDPKSNTDPNFDLLSSKIEQEIERMKAETSVEREKARQEEVKADQARYNLNKSKEEDNKFS